MPKTTKEHFEEKARKWGRKELTPFTLGWIEGIAESGIKTPAKKVKEIQEALKAYDTVMAMLEIPWVDCQKGVIEGDT